jgi:predicted membrane-bound spermidine synthase
MRPPRLRAEGAYYLLFAASGFAGLIYESIWSHYLKLFLGHAAYAQSLVLMIFMGGLALGSWLVARYGTAWRLPILVYAAVEGLVGLLALAFHGTFVALTGAFYNLILPAVGTPLLGAILKWSAAAALLVPQSVLLGMTFPLLSAGLLRRYGDNPGGTLAMLYFTNSAGAAVGVLASGFWLISAVGLPGTIRAAGLLNLALAAAIALLVGTDPGRAAPGLPAPMQAPENRRTAQLLLLAAFVTGLASFIYEIGWIRMLSLVLGSTTHSFELMLSAFITGLAFGGLWIRRRIDTLDDPLRFAAWLQVLMGTVAVLSVPVYARSFGWMAALVQAVSHTEQGYRLFMLASHGIALAVMLPATLLAGMTLPLFTHVMMRGGAGEGAIGRVYAANTLGAILGVLLAVHLGLPLLGLKNLIGAGALLDVLLGLGLLLYIGGRQGAGQLLRVLGPPALLGLGTTAVVLVAGGLTPQVLASGVYRFGRSSLGEDVTVPFYRDGKTASVAVALHADNYQAIITNGKPDAALRLDVRPRSNAFGDEGTMVLAGALPIAYSAQPRAAAVIGIGSGMSTSVLLSDPRLRSVDTVEIEPAMVEGAHLFAPRVSRAFEDPRSHIYIEDAKTFFPLRNQVYGIIIAEPSNPWVSGVASLFSREFYGLIGRYLADDGIFVQWLQLYEFNDELAFSVLKALGEHFDDFVIYTHLNVDAVIVARKRGRLGNPDYGRLYASVAAVDLVAAGFPGPADLILRRTLFKPQVMAQISESIVPANSDFFPYLDQHAGAARIRHQSAHFLEAGTAAPLPVLEMLTGAPWSAGAIAADAGFDRAVGVQTAATLHGALVRGEPIRGDFKMREPIGYPLTAVSALARTCELATGGEGYLRALHVVAENALAFLPPERALELVHSAGGQCASAPPNAALWIAVYKAVANRDAAAMSVSAQRALDNARPEDERRRAYLIGTMMLGELARGNSDRAANLWYRYRGATLFGEGSPDVPGWLGLLRQLAFHGAHYRNAESLCKQTGCGNSDPVYSRAT